MDGVEKFVTEQNVFRFIDRLGRERRGPERITIAQLLKREEDKFAEGAERHDAVESWIERCDSLIARNNRLMENASEPNRALLDGNSRAMEAIRETLVSLRLTWAREMEHAAKFAGKD